MMGILGKLQSFNFFFPWRLKLSQDMHPVLTISSWVDARLHAAGSQMATLPLSCASSSPLLPTPSAPLISRADPFLGYDGGSEMRQN